MADIHITAAIPEDVLAALDAWIASEPAPNLTREQAVALAVCEWLAAMGRIAPRACAEEASA